MHLYIWIGLFFRQSIYSTDIFNPNDHLYINAFYKVFVKSDRSWLSVKPPWPQRNRNHNENRKLFFTASAKSRRRDRLAELGDGDGLLRSERSNPRAGGDKCCSWKRISAGVWGI